MQTSGVVYNRIGTVRICHHPFLQPSTRCKTNRYKFQCRAQSTAYKPPSSSTAATELERIEQFSVVVPDTVLMQNINDIENPKAATVSSVVLTGILSNPTGLKEYEVCRCHKHQTQQGSGI